VLAGDIVSRKKPAPDIYLAALDALDCRPGNTVVIEDSANGVASAQAAGLPCMVTQSEYSRDEDLTGAGIIVSGLGDPGSDPVKVILNKTSVPILDYVQLAHLAALMHNGS
jgi:beta-phosphoglucomutase-like phosphatase (HAD superfamily)